MRVLFVSTWGSSCGIATYTEELVAGSKDLWDSCVASPAELGSGIRETPPVPSRQYWQRTSPVLEQQLFQAVEDFQPDVVHIQHEHGLFRIPVIFLRAVRALRRRVPVVVTLHTASWSGGWKHTLWYKDLGKCVDRIVVHTPEAMASLVLCAPNTVCIAHGTGPVEFDGDRERGIKLLQPAPSIARILLTNVTPICLLHGFIGPRKNLLCTLRAIATVEARGLCRSIVTIITGEGNDTFLCQLQGMLGVTGLEMRTIVHPSFVAARDVPHLFALADFGILNTTGRTLSTSGVAHVYARHGVALGVANRPIYYEAIRGGALSFDLDRKPGLPTDAAVNTIAALAESSRLREQTTESLRTWARQTQWPLVAAEHLALYHTVLKEKNDTRGV